MKVCKSVIFVLLLSSSISISGCINMYSVPERLVEIKQSRIKQFEFGYNYNSRNPDEMELKHLNFILSKNEHVDLFKLSMQLYEKIQESQMEANIDSVELEKYNHLEIGESIIYFTVVPESKYEPGIELNYSMPNRKYAVFYVKRYLSDPYSYLDLDKNPEIKNLLFKLFEEAKKIKK